MVMLQNYSRAGLCVLTSRPERPGEQIHFHVDDPEQLLVVARTQWQLKVGQNYLLGCVFLNERDFERMQRICAASEATGGLA